MPPAMEVLLAGDSSASSQHGRLWRHVLFVASKRVRRLVFSQSEASPQQAESRSAVVRQIYTNLMAQILTNIGMRQVFQLSLDPTKIAIPVRPANTLTDLSRHDYS